jgi:hypothetical protein
MATFVMCGKCSMEAVQQISTGRNQKAQVLVVELYRRVFR